MHFSDENVAAHKSIKFSKTVIVCSNKALKLLFRAPFIYKQYLTTLPSVCQSVRTYHSLPPHDAVFETDEFTLPNYMPTCACNKTESSPPQHTHTHRYTYRHMHSTSVTHALLSVQVMLLGVCERCEQFDQIRVWAVRWCTGPPQIMCC